MVATLPQAAHRRTPMDSDSAVKFAESLIGWKEAERDASGRKIKAETDLFNAVREQDRITEELRRSVGRNLPVRLVKTDSGHSVIIRHVEDSKPKVEIFGPDGKPQ